MKDFSNDTIILLIITLITIIIIIVIIIIVIIIILVIVIIVIIIVMITGDSLSHEQKGLFSLSRDGVSMKTLVGGNHKTQPKIEWNVKSMNWK